jgi:hypothetical protein
MCTTTIKILLNLAQYNFLRTESHHLHYHHYLQQRGRRGRERGKRSEKEARMHHLVNCAFY